MTQPHKEFSEFAFTFAVGHQLTNLRQGTLSPLQFKRLIRTIPEGKIHITKDDERVIRSHLIYCEEKAKFIQGLIESWMHDYKVKYSEKISKTIGDPGGPGYIPSPFVESSFPVDLAMNVRGVYCFLQFKRSAPILRKNVVHMTRLKERDEVDNGLLTFPLYRVEFPGNSNGESGAKKQWEKLEKLEMHLASESAALVRYVAPAFHTLSELTYFHNFGFRSLISGRSPVVCFKASDFDLSDNCFHSVSFDGTTKDLRDRSGKTLTGFCYSSEPNGVLVLPLIDALDSLVEEENVPMLKNSIGPISKILDTLASEIDENDVSEMDKKNAVKREKKEDYPKELLNRALLNVLDISIVTASAQPGEPTERTARGIGDPQKSDVKADRESEFAAELADTIRGIIRTSDFETVRSRVSFANDYCRADYRCRQILKQPLMVHSILDPKDFP